MTNEYQGVDLKQALRLVEVYTAGRFDLWMLAGSSNAARRAQVMSTLLGTKVPQSKSGVTMLVSEFHAALGIPKIDCAASREDWFVAIAKHSEVL